MGDLFERPGLPPELRVLVAAYPREVWPAHPNLGDTAALWLQRHAMFRDLGGQLTGAASDLAEGRRDGGPFLAWFAPRAGFFLNELHAHHMIEDVHYFPVFRTADPRLAAGFELLDADHVTLDRLIHEFADATNALGEALTGTGEAAGAAATLAQRSGHTLAGLLRHLDDEEDLVVPLILERTEAGLGLK